jgi:gluconolactonase
MGADIAPALYLANPVHPYNTTLLVNNYYGRQFNSLNDVAVNPANGDIYFTDVTYGYLQDFRPAPAIKNQVYRLDAETKALSVVADEQLNCNGITFSPDGKYAYITETGGAQGFYGFDDAAAAGM